jgi:mRNA-degrading endonuclease toxin of MazEF toxin-antitoxin module
MLVVNDSNADGMPIRCAVNLDEIITIPRSPLLKHITRLSIPKI